MGGTMADWALLAAFLSLAGCADTGLPLDGTPVSAAYILPACVVLCTSHVGKEDVTATGAGNASGGGLASTSGNQGSAN